MKEMPTFGGTQGSLIRDLVQSLRKPEFWSYSAWLEIATKYRRSRLGILWMMIPAALYVWGMGWFFSGLRAGAIGPYIAHMGVGFLMFRLVMMVVSESASVAVSQRAFILDGRTRMTDFVLRVVAKAFFYLLMSIPVVLPALFMHVDGGGWPSLVLPVAGLLLVVLNCIWMAALVAIAGARFPDIHEFTTSLYILGFVFTPILWHAADAPAGTFRGVVMRLNPIYHMIEVVRAPLLANTDDRLSWVVVASMAVAGWGLAAILYRRYVRMVPLWV